MTLDELATLNKPALEDYFLGHAQYSPSACEATKYQIQIGPRFLRSADTMDLRRQFNRRVSIRKREIERRGKT